MSPIFCRPIQAVRRHPLPLAPLLVGSLLVAGCRAVRPDPPSQTIVARHVTQTGSNIPQPVSQEQPATPAERKAAKKDARAKPKPEKPASAPAEEEDIVIRGGFR